VSAYKVDVAYGYTTECSDCHYEGGICIGIYDTPEEALQAGIDDATDHLNEWDEEKECYEDRWGHQVRVDTFATVTRSR
jgi:hypothetical protein